MMRPLSFLRLAAGLGVLAALAGGCRVDPEKPTPPKVVNLGLRNVPGFMKGTLYEQTNLENDSPFLVSGWGLVVNLNGTGGSDQISNNLKAFMSKQLEAKGFGRKVSPELKTITPERVLADKNVAVVGVYGALPPGVHKGQWFDVRVLADQAGREEVKSLARGHLYETSLTIDGANPINPTPPVNVWATASGPVFVNPAMALKFSEQADGSVTKSLRVGYVIGGGRSQTDRPLLLRLRQPENRLARAIELRVNEFFHEDQVCRAKDQAYCELYVPADYGDDWEHLSKLVQHLYLQGGSEAFARAKARELAGEARHTGAPLQDISYCWEGLGKYALPELSALLSDAGVTPEVRFAAARAAAYVGDPSGAADRCLYEFAADQKSDFQVAAVQVLGRVKNSHAVNQLLRDLLDSSSTTVRVEAYSILARHHDPSVETRIIGSARDATDQKFVLDFVHSMGKPLIYATVKGIPRIAIFGSVPKLALPLTFSAMDNHLMLASRPVGREVTIFYRDSHLDEPLMMSSPPDLANVISRLAGQYDDGGGRQMDFTYAEVLAVLQALTDQQKLRVTMPTGQELAAALLVQQPSGAGDVIDNAPRLDRGRPDGENTAPSIESQGSPGRPQGPVGMVSNGAGATGK
jgi:flagellar P-ring protein FlgI